MARRSSRLDTPPDAITGASVRSATPASSSRLGPFSVPSLVTSVTTNREHPSPSRRSSTAHRSPPSVSQPRPRSRCSPSTIFTSSPTATLSPCSAIDPGTPLRVLQRRGTEIDPGATGGQRRGQRLVVADPARQLDGDVELADHLGEQFTVASRGRTRRRGRRGGSTRRRRAASSSRRRARSRTRSRCPPALHQAHGLAVDHVDGGQAVSTLTAVNLEPLDPIAEQRRTSVAALLGMELGGGQRSVLDGGQERHVVGRPGQQRVGVALPPLRGVGVHEVEPGGRRPGP